MIRRRLTAQGNGQAALDHQGTRPPGYAGTVPRGNRAGVKMAARWLAPGSETPRQVRAWSCYLNES
jgi:hypothetical protein